jgi:hypothetical protein
MLGVFARVLESNEARQGMAHHGQSVEAQSFAHLVDIVNERVQGDAINLRGRFRLRTVPEVHENELEVPAQIFREDRPIVMSVHDDARNSVPLDHITQLCAIGSRYFYRSWVLSVYRKRRGKIKTA